LPAKTLVEGLRDRLIEQIAAVSDYEQWTGRCILANRPAHETLFDCSLWTANSLSIRPSPARMRKRIADVLRAECAKCGRGKPGGAHWRWTKPHYLIAHFIEQSGAKRTDGCIRDWINTVNGWETMRDRQRLDPQPGSRDHGRIRELLRGPKSRRL
jgi:hypothetical protein